MSLTVGTRLGPYEIVSPLGAGGMGEVYRARDTRLDRTVAIKVLPEHTASDPEFRQRFEREAKVISQISHPHICALYDVGDHALPDAEPGGRDESRRARGTIAYLVLEYLEGETLAARIERGPLAVADTLRLGQEIASALDKAHRAGIVHRDLKPGNVMMTKAGAKLLDFGLARAIVPAGPATSVTVAPTRTTPLTAQGTILGTFQYMAPEQLEGRDADTRADIWALGCLLYECLTGARAYTGASQASLIGAILKDQPNLTSLSPALGRVVATCLAKDPDDRWQSAADLTRELRWIADGGGTPAVVPATRANAPRRRAAWIAGAVLLAPAVSLLTWIVARPPAASPPGATPVRATLPLATVDGYAGIATGEGQNLAVSPDGRFVAYVAANRLALLLVTLDTGDTRVLARGGAINEPFFSPDSRFVGFVAGQFSGNLGLRGAIQKAAVTGGAPTTIVEGVSSMKGACWSTDGWIYYSPAPGMGLWRVRDSGGQPEVLTTPDADKGEKTHRRPWVLPDGRTILFVVGTARMESFDESRIEALSLPDRSRHPLIQGGTAPFYSATTGQLVYERAGSLVAVPFDPERLAVSGAPVTVLDGVANLTENGTAFYGVSASGTLVYVPVDRVARRSTILAADRQGRLTKLADGPQKPGLLRVSADGRRTVSGADYATTQLTFIDFRSSETQRVTFEWDNASPVWIDDDRHLVFSSNRGGGARNLHRQAAGLGATAERLTTDPREQFATDARGRWVIYAQVDPSTGLDLMLFSLDDGQSQDLVKTPFEEGSGTFSPDGQWITYQSNQSGRFEIYMQPFPATGQPSQISSAGGTTPIWMPDGRKIVYRSGSDVWAVAVTASPDVHRRAAQKLFTLGPLEDLHDALPDGRLLIVRLDERPPVGSLNLIVNWFESLRRLTRDAAAGR